MLTGGLDIQGAPTNFTNFVGIGAAFGQIPWIFVIAGVFALVLGLVLRYTRFGRYTYAIGSNPEAARRAGIRVDRHLLKVYALSGALAGVAGWMSVAQFSGTTIAGHTTDNLDAIAAVVLGGTSLFGEWVPSEAQLSEFSSRLCLQTVF